MATLKHSLRSYFKTPFVTVYNGFFSLEKNFLCFSRKLNRKKANSVCMACHWIEPSFESLQKIHDYIPLIFSFSTNLIILFPYCFKPSDFNPEIFNEISYKSNFFKSQYIFLPENLLIEIRMLPSHNQVFKKPHWPYITVISALGTTLGLHKFILLKFG